MPKQLLVVNLLLSQGTGAEVERWCGRVFALLDQHPDLQEVH